MALIDHTWFEGGNINIPNTHTKEVSESLKLFIDKWQRKILRDLFGYPLFKEFEAATSGYDIDTANVTIDQKWINLIEGAEYTKSNNNIEKFDGLQDIVANYVYFRWKEDEYTQSTSLGEGKSKAEMSSNENPAAKMIAAWNEMYDGLCVLYDYMQQNKDTYPEWADHTSKYFTFHRDYAHLNHWGI